jgi:hypothetical protein
VLRYEDLRDRPAEALERVVAKFGLDLADTIARLEHGRPLDAGHVIGGNGVRHEGELRFDPGKERTRPRPPRWVEVMTVLFCWPLTGRYGYRRRGAPSAAAGIDPGHA